MKHYQIVLFAAAAALFLSCNNHKQDNNLNVSLSPQAGTSYPAGTPVELKVSYPSSITPDSVVYLLDAVRIGSKKDSSTLSLKTDTMALGVKTFTVKVYKDGKSDDASTNIVLLAAKAPEMLSYKIDHVFPHDTSSFTEGLEYHDGVFYESDGGYISEGEGQSSLRKVDVTTGKPVQKIDIDPKVFAEGITLIDNKIVQLTYKEKMGYVYDAKTFKLLSTFDFNAAPEGWGLCNDGKQLYATVGSVKGTNQIIILNKNTYQQVGEINVYDDKGPVTDLNELELINGKFYANIWQTNFIVVINPKTGAVEQKIDFGTLYPEAQRNEQNPPADVLNGIAWDAAGKRLFITGKKWPHLYQISLSPAGH